MPVSGNPLRAPALRQRSRYDGTQGIFIRVHIQDQGAHQVRKNETEGADEIYDLAERFSSDHGSSCYGR